MTIHQNAYDQIRAAYARVFGRAPSDCEVAIIAGVAWHETNYGLGWKGDGAGSFNMGAITAGPSWNGDTFEHKDTRPEGGIDVEYVTKFRKYASSDAGFEDLIRVLLTGNRSHVRGLAMSCNTEGVARAMYETGYYKGLAKYSPETRITKYREAIEGGIKTAGIVPIVSFNHGTSLWPWAILLAAAGIFWATTRSPLRPDNLLGRSSPKFSNRRVRA